MATQMKIEEEYLGDAVYVSIDNEMIRLRCAAPSERDVIYLDESVYANLKMYVDKQYNNRIST
mgnify:CR=1 FL=1